VARPARGAPDTAAGEGDKQHGKGWEPEEPKAAIQPGKAEPKERKAASSGESQREQTKGGGREGGQPVGRRAVKQRKRTTHPWKGHSPQRRRRAHGRAGERNAQARENKARNLDKQEERGDGPDA